MPLKDWIKVGENCYACKGFTSSRVWVEPYRGKTGKTYYEVWCTYMGDGGRGEPMSSHRTKKAAHAALMKFIRSN